MASNQNFKAIYFPDYKETNPKTDENGSKGIKYSRSLDERER